MYDKVRRIDFLGSSTLVGTVGTLLLGFSLKSTEELPWSHPLIWSLFVVSAVCCVGFIYVETHIAPYPVVPMHLITRRTPLFVSLSNLYGFWLLFQATIMLTDKCSFGSVAAFSVVCNNYDSLLHTSKFCPYAVIQCPLGMVSTFLPPVYCDRFSSAICIHM